MGIMLGDKESPALVHGAVHGLLEELKDRENGGWYPGITPDNKMCIRDSMHNIVTSGVGLFGPNMRVGTKSEICDVSICFN